MRALVRGRLRLSGRIDIVAEAGDGAEAVAATRRHRPDLVLLDVSMPVLDGFGALPQIRAASPRTKIVMFSGIFEPGLVRRAHELGASAFWEKPPSFDTLAEDLLDVLGGADAAARGERPAAPADPGEPGEPAAFEAGRIADEETPFRLLVDNVEDYAIFMLSPAGEVASWNAGAQRTSGYRAEEILGRHFRVFYPPEQQRARHPEHELEVALREGRYEEEGWRVRQDGSRFWATVVITAVRATGGRHVGFAKVTRDITERRQMMQERETAAAALAEANVRLQQAADDQARFLAVTAHELRTPVSVLGGTADLLAGRWGALEVEEREELLAGMTASAVRLRRLLDDLLTASRLQASRLELRIDEFDLVPVLTASVAAARHSHPEVSIILEAGPEPGPVIAGDAGRIAQIVDNLLANALMHGVPPIGVALEAGADDVLISVHDAGEGVPAPIRDRLFERFATGRSAGGTGLGLYIVRQLARGHGGDAWYRPPGASSPGAFQVRLPRTGPPAAPTPASTPAPTRRDQVLADGC